jgi:hypothetical protein
VPQSKPVIDVRDLGVDCTGVADASTILNALTGNAPTTNNAITNRTLSFANCPNVNLANTWLIKNQASFKIDAFTRSGSAAKGTTITWSGAASGTMVDMEYVDGFEVHGIYFFGSTNGGIGLNIDKTGAGGVWNTTDGRITDDAFQGNATNWIGVFLSATSSNNVERMRVEDSAFYCGAAVSTTAGVGIEVGPNANAKSETFKHNSFTQCFYAIYQQNGSMFVLDNEFELNGGTCASGSGSDIRINTNSDVDIIENNVGEDDLQGINTNNDASGGGPNFPVIIKGNHWGTAGCENTAKYFINTPSGQQWIIEGNGWDADAGLTKVIGTSNNGNGATIYTKGNTWPNATFGKWWTNFNVANAEDLKVMDDLMFTSPVYSGTGPNYSSAFLDFRAYTSVGVASPDDYILQNIPAGGLTNQGGTFLVKHQQGATGTEIFGWDGSYGDIAIAAIPTPAILSVSQGGTPASTSYTYAIVAYGPQGNTAGSATVNTATGATTLNSTNFNLIQWYPVAGATKYCIWRTASSGTPNSTGDIGCTSALQFKTNSNIPTFGYTINAGLFTSAYKFSDTGLAGDSAGLPATNTTGTLSLPGKITSTLATGTAPLSIASTTPVANLTVSNHPTLDDCGSTSTCSATQKTAALIVRGSVAFPTATTVTVTALPFTSSSSYSCTAGDATTAAGVINATTYTSGSSVTFTETSGVNTDTIRYICVGF